MFEGLESGIGVVAGLDPDALSDAELSEALVELGRLSARLDAATARLTQAWDVRGCWRADRARSAAAWLAYRSRMSQPVARRQVRLGRAVRHMPATEAAWAAGEITAEHVAVLVRARTTERAEQFDSDEQALVEVAREARFEDFCRAVSYWCQAADPDGVEVDADAQRQRRRVHLSESLDGMWFADVVLDPIGGTIVAGQLRAIEDELFDQDWAQARARLGADPTVADLARTPAQRRADALVEMAQRAGTAPADGRRPAPLFTVLVGYETFAGRICELANGAVVTPGSLIPWLDEAYIERIVFDGPSRVLDVGIRRRLFRGATRRAVEVRDRRCYEPACDAAFDRLQIDHIKPYTRGGLTIQANGRCACGHHNRSRNRIRPDDPPDDGEPP